jgi:SAM-dependent methyltransferase
VPLALPPPVERALAVIRPRIEAQATGRVLDLGAVGPALFDLAGTPSPVGATSGRAALAPPPEPLPEAERYDTVLSIAALAAHADLPAALAALRRLLAPRGRLLAVEPTRGPDHLSFLAGALPRARSRPSGPRVHLGRDLPRLLRSADLWPSDLERFSMPTRSPSLRPWVRLVVGGDA